MVHYVYKITDSISNEYYIGSRTCNKLAIDDIGYMGSMITWKPTKSNLVKTIIKDDFKNRELAIKYELKLVKKYINHPLNRNYCLPNKTFGKSGCVTVKDLNGKCFIVSKLDKRYLNGELVGVNKGYKPTQESLSKMKNAHKKFIKSLTREERQKKWPRSGKLNPNYGKNWSNEWKSKQRDRMVEYYSNNPASNTGKKFREDWKKNLSNSRIRLKIAAGSNNPNSYGNVEIVDLNGNSQTFDTAKEASMKLKVSRITLTKHCKNNTTYQRGKYKGWQFSLISNIK